MVSRQLSSEERNYYQRLIEQLVRLRKAKGLSQEALDDRLGVSDGMVAKWETAARLPGAFFLMCWCKALGVQLSVYEEQ
jgi:transcriptional regulator with XRE-family HTH domain